MVDSTLLPPFVLPVTDAVGPTLVVLGTAAAAGVMGLGITNLGTTAGNAVLNSEVANAGTKTDVAVWSFPFPSEFHLGDAIPLTVYGYKVGTGPGTVTMTCSVRKQGLDGTFGAELVTGSVPNPGTIGAATAGVVATGTANNAVVFTVNSDGFSPGDRLVVDLTTQVIASAATNLAAGITAVKWG